MNKGWLELESDPGLFTLLLEDFGVRGVQVEEIYDLQKPFDGPVYGFIFLFKWIEERRSRRKVTQEEESFVMDDTVINNIFFAQQLIANSCATHALLSIMLNCDQNVKLGETLTKLNAFTANMNAEDKGYAIGNMPDLAKAHNSHARPEPYPLPEKQQGISVRTKEAFHYVSYVPIGGRLFELDGLKPFPIDHGPWGDKEEWTEKFRRVITERLGMASGQGGEPYHDIRFNLMAVVPDRRNMYEQKLKTLKTNRQIVLEALQQMVKVTGLESDLTSRHSRYTCSLEGKSEPICTRSVTAAAKEAAAVVAAHGLEDQLGPHRSMRLKHKASLAHDCTSLSAEGKSAMDCNSIKLEVTEDEDESSCLEHSGLEADLHSSHRLCSSGSTAKIRISVTNANDNTTAIPTSVATTDVTMPLVIQTKFASSSPGPGSSSTETASEVASLLSSPTVSASSSTQCSPNMSPEKGFKGSPPDISISIKMELEEKLARARELQAQLATDSKFALAFGSVIKQEGEEMKVEDMDMDMDEMDTLRAPGSAASSSSSSSTTSHLDNHQGFTPKDLLELLKNVENEISMCEINLRDEIEKRKKYKIDDSRRTHNYDQFICTFLSMLAEQGQLGSLVEDHMRVKRRQGASIGRLHKTAPKPTDRRRRARPKRRK